MIVEACQAVGHFDLRHVATCAIVRSNRTRFGNRFIDRVSSRTFSDMACQALGVVRSGIGNQLFVWIMTGDTTDPRIGSFKALANRQPVRLEAYVDFSAPGAANDRLPAAMALATEIRQVLRCKLP